MSRATTEPVWLPLEVIGPACKERFIRMRARMDFAHNIAVVYKPAAPRRIALPKGAIGFCYAASGVMHVGFTKDFSRVALASPTLYEYAVTFTPSEMRYLEVEAKT
jgi:hypothetical protein